MPATSRTTGVIAFLYTLKVCTGRDEEATAPSMLLPNLGALRLREAPTGAFPLAQLPQNLFDLVVEKLVAQMVVGSEEPDMCAQVELTCNQLHLVLSQLRKDGLFIDPKYDCSNPDAEVWKAAHAAFGVDPDEVQRTKEAGVSWKYNFHTLCRVFTTPMTFEVDEGYGDLNPEHPHKWVSWDLWEWFMEAVVLEDGSEDGVDMREAWSWDLKEMLRNPETQNRDLLAKIMIKLIDENINANYLELPQLPLSAQLVDDDGNEHSPSGESTRVIFKDDTGVKCECCGRFGDDTATKIRKYLRDISAFRNLLLAMIPEP